MSVLYCSLGSVGIDIKREYACCSGPSRRERKDARAGTDISNSFATEVQAQQESREKRAC
jgi:hypothetical protein